MSLRTETVRVDKEIGVHFCDHCGERIGEAPIADHGGYFLSCSIAARGDTRPLWMAELCTDCMNELRAWAERRAGGSEEGGEK